MKEKTIIISCAGIGSRLGKDMPKCLVEINGKSIIEWQLNQLKDIDDIRVVVGYKKDMVIDKIKNINKNVKIYENNNYMNTGTAGSFSIALKDNPKDMVIALDGDLLVNPVDMNEILNSNEEFICGEIKNTTNPVLVTVDENNYVTKFSREIGQYEWAGLAQLKKENWKTGNNHIYQLIENNLPIKFKLIRAKEIDTKEDLIAASTWIKENFLESKEIIDKWWQSRFEVKDNYEACRHSINNRIIYDIDLLKNYVTPNSKVLDLGCGTGILENYLINYVKYIKAIDKYQEFLNRTDKHKNIDYIKSDIVNYNDNQKYDLITMFGLTMYIVDEELKCILNNCFNMMNNDSHLIIKNQWSLSNDDLIINKQYSNTNKNQYYGIYRSLPKIKSILDEMGFSYIINDLYSQELNKYENTHEYAFICKKKSR